MDFSSGLPRVEVVKEEVRPKVRSYVAQRRSLLLQDLVVKDLQETHGSFLC